MLHRVVGWIADDVHAYVIENMKQKVESAPSCMAVVVVIS